MNPRKSYAVLFSVFCAAAFCLPQLAQGQTGLFRNFEETRLRRNPAFAGANGAASVSAAARLEHLNRDDAGRTFLVLYEAPSEALRGGWGVSVLHFDGGGYDIDMIRATELRLSYARPFSLGPEATLRAGLAASLARSATTTGDRLRGLSESRVNDPERSVSGSVSAGLALQAGNFEAGAAWSNPAAFGAVTEEADISAEPGARDFHQRWSMLSVSARFVAKIGDKYEITPAAIHRHFPRESIYATEARTTFGLKGRRLFLGGGAGVWNWGNTGDYFSRPAFWTAAAGGRPMKKLELAAALEGPAGERAGSNFNRNGLTFEFSASWFFGEAPAE